MAQLRPLRLLRTQAGVVGVVGLCNALLLSQKRYR